jgi:CheY-like chemotaxis protein
VNILVVDDEFINQKMACRFLEKLGYSADTSNTGEESLEAMNNKSYDLVLMDINMPGINGIETCKKWKEAGSSAIIVAVSANDEEEDRKLYFDSGFDDVMPKPITKDGLSQLIEKHINRSA